MILEEMRDSITTKLKNEDPSTYLEDFQIEQIDEYSDSNIPQKGAKIPSQIIHTTMAVSEDTWSQAGYSIRAFQVSALERIRSLRLKTFKLTEDSKKNMQVSTKERRTRVHSGVIDEDETIMGNSDWFAINLKAVADLEDRVQQFASSVALLRNITSSTAFVVNFTRHLDERASLAQWEDMNELSQSNLAVVHLEGKLKHIKHLTTLHRLHQAAALRSRNDETRHESTLKIAMIDDSLRQLREQRELELKAQLETVSQFSSLVRNILTSKQEARR